MRSRLLGDGKAELRPTRGPHQPDWLVDQLEAQRLQGGRDVGEGRSSCGSARRHPSRSGKLRTRLRVGTPSICQAAFECPSLVGMASKATACLSSEMVFSWPQRPEP